MRVLLLMSCVAVCAMAAPASGSTQDPFVAFLKDVEAQPFFKTLSEDYTVLTYEMLTAAETGNLSPLLHRLGHAPLLDYLDKLPKDFSHKFITYAVQHLVAEGASTDFPFL